LGARKQVHPLFQIHRLSHQQLRRWRIYFRGRTYVEGGGGFPDRLGPPIERVYTVEVAPRADRPVLDRTENLSQEDAEALQSSDTNRGQLISSFQRLAIRRALEVLSSNKEEAIRLRDIYDDPSSDTRPRVAQARELYPPYAQLRERREGFEEQVNLPRPSASVCARNGYCEGEWQENRHTAQVNLEETPDHAHEIEVYGHGIGRCSSVPGQFCPLIPDVYKPVLRRRPRANAELILLQGQITRLTRQGEEVPQRLLDRVANLEMRLRNLEQVDRISTVPHTWQILEVNYYDYRAIADVVPGPGVVLEFPDGTRVWRDTPGGPIRHESTIGEGVGRQHFERKHYSATVHGRRPAGPRYERSHTLGQGTGFESSYGIYDAPAFVNQELQNRGIEDYMRQWRSLRGKSRGFLNKE
jgi:hypothetical protein